MLPDEIINSWQRRNISWINQSFSSFNNVTIEPTTDEDGIITGHVYTFCQAIPNARFSTVQKGEICGDHGGMTKSGAPCKKSGSNIGFRCNSHLLGPVDITLKLPHDSLLRPMPCDVLDMPFFYQNEKLSVNVHAAFVSCSEVVADCLADVVPLDFLVKDGIREIAASPFWRIEKLRDIAQHDGPWTTSSNQSVAKEGYFVRDYEPGLWY